MNYAEIYNQLISRARLRSALITDYEVHHIIPRCMGGDNSSSNLVRLTYREHFFAHELLAKIYPYENGLLYAVYLMSNKNQYTNSRQYKWIREKQITHRYTEQDILDCSKYCNSIDAIAKELDYKNHKRIRDILIQNNVEWIKPLTISDQDIIDASKTNHSYDSIAKFLNYTNTSRIKNVLVEHNITLHRSGITEEMIIATATNASSYADVCRLLNYNSPTRVKNVLNKHDIFFNHKNSSNK